MNTKFCKDCAHYQGWYSLFKGSECTNPSNARISLVTGKTEYAFTFARTLRNASIKSVSTMCGKEGRWFEAKK